MRLSLDGVTKSYGARLVLDKVACRRPAQPPRPRRPERRRQVDAAPPPRRLEEPDAGTVVRDARDAARRLPRAGAGRRRRRDAAALPRAAHGGRRRGGELDGDRGDREGPGRVDRYAGARALPRARRRRSRGAGARASAPSSGSASRSTGPTATLSGGEAARAALAAILLSRFDVFLLDEPTNDLDFEGLARLERFLATSPGGVVGRLARPRVPRHDGDPRRGDRAGHAPRARVGGRLVRVRRGPRRRARTGLRRLRAGRRSGGASCGAPGAARRTEARARRGAGRPPRNARADDEGAPGRAGARARSSAREAVRAVGAPPRARRGAAHRRSRRRARGAVVERGGFRLGPIDLDLAPGERVVITGATAAASRRCSRCCSASCRSSRATAWSAGDGDRDDRPAPGSYRRRAAPRRVPARAGLAPEEARTLLAKFGLGADHVGRPARRCHPASGRERNSPSCRRGGSTCSSSTSRRTTSTWRRSSSSSWRSPAYAEPSSSSRTTGASWKRSRRPAIAALAILRSRSWPSRREKTSKARRDKRRAQHGIEAPRVNVCPNCGSADAAASRLPDLQDVPGPRDRAAPHSGAVAPWLRVAVDALGGRPGAGARSSPARSTRRGRDRSPSFGPAGLDTHGLRARRDDGDDRDGRQARRGGARASPTPRSSPRRARSATASRRRRLGREHRRDARRVPAPPPAAPGRAPPAIAVVIPPSAGRPS